jgi:hypothetical protein
MQKVIYMRTPRLIIIGLLIFIALGRVMPMTLMPEPGDPWYLSYTTIWFFVAGILFLPSALVTQAVGLSFSGVSYLFVDAIWLIALCLFIYFNPFKSSLSPDDDR